MTPPTIQQDARNRIFYNDSIAGYLKDGCAIMDKRYATAYMRVWLTQRQGYTVLWREDIAERFPSDTRPALQSLPSRVRLWQLRPDALLALHFLDYDQLVCQYGEPDPHSYHCVFDEDLATDDLAAICNILENEYPISPNTHELSVSDILELYSEDANSFHYVSSEGVQEILFQPQECPHIISPKWQLAMG